ncbi:hypothetical protein K0H63_02215 [Shewanella zhangzhouensis]|nr:hypothetical protein K0H79_02165 [Shewanella sp. FJAT-52076]QYK07060.1 hypothetical protein K0H63_02215 [Shewanella zhangzhouensis]
MSHCNKSAVIVGTRMLCIGGGDGVF